VNQHENPFDPTKMVWFGLIVLAIIGLGIAMLQPPGQTPEAAATPAPSPEIASLQCLDGKTYRSVDEIASQPREGEFLPRSRWTIAFANGGYVVDQAGVSEAGRYRCDGATVVAKNALGSHRGFIDAAAGRLAWDGQGFELVDPAATPATTTTSS